MGWNWGTVTVSSLFCYHLSDRVRIVPLETDGRIIGLYYCEDGAQYRVRYFYEGSVRTEYFYADELQNAKP